MKIQHLAMASVPIQTWGQIYDNQTALKKGTIFQELDMPFFAADDGGMRVLLSGFRYGRPQSEGERRKDAADLPGLFCSG